MDGYRIVCEDDYLTAQDTINKLAQQDYVIIKILVIPTSRFLPESASTVWFLLEHQDFNVQGDTPYPGDKFWNPQPG